MSLCLLNRKDTVKIRGSNADDFISKLLPELKSHSENVEKVIEDYNRQEIRYPITILSQVLGKNMLNICEFLAFQNKDRIRNNLSYCDEEQDPPVFILSYDAIVFLSYADYDHRKLAIQKLFCARQVKNQLLNDIDLANMSEF